MHIADAPCHGTQFHNLGSDEDYYPEGDPDGISHESMMEQVAKMEIQYWFGYINRSATEKMIGVFDNCLRTLSSDRSIIRQLNAMESKDIGTEILR